MSNQPIDRKMQNPLRRHHFVFRPAFVLAAKRAIIDDLLEQLEDLTNEEIAGEEGQEIANAIVKVGEIQDVLGIHDYLLSSELHCYEEGEDVWTAIIDYALT